MEAWNFQIFVWQEAVNRQVFIVTDFDIRSNFDLPSITSDFPVRSEPMPDW